MPNTKKPLTAQVGESLTCDFRTNTWTFEMPKNFIFTGGKFAILPNIEFQKQEAKIVKLKKLLYQVEVFMEQERMNSNYNGIWRDDDETILANVKAESLETV